MPGGRLSELTIRGFEPGSNPLPSVLSAEAPAPAPEAGAVAGAPSPTDVELRAPPSAAARGADVQRGAAALQVLLLVAAGALLVT